MATFNNTIINRLGYTRAWEMSWAENSFRMYKNYIQKDFLLFRLIKIYFVHYSTSFFTHKFHRNIKEGKKKSAKKHIINNYFVDFGINFSHLEITRNPYLGLNCYFMDTLMEDWKLRYNYKAKKLPSFYIRTREHTRVSLYKNKDKVQRKQYPIYPKLRKRRFLAKIHLLKKAKPYAFRHKCNINRVLTINKRKCNVSKHLYPFKIYKNIKEKLKIIKRKALAKKDNTKFYRLMNEMFKKRNSHIKPIKQKVNVKRVKRYKPKIKKHKKLHFLYKNTATLENIKISKRRIFKGRFRKFRVKKLFYNMTEELKLIYGKNCFRRNPRKYRIMQKGIKHTPYMKEEAAAADLIKRYKKLKMAKNKKYKAYCKKRKVKLLVIDTHTTVSGNYVISYSKNTKVLAIPSIPLTVKKQNLYNTKIFMHSLYVRQSLLNITKRYMQNNKTVAKEIGKDVVKSITPQQTTPTSINPQKTPTSTSPQKTRLSTKNLKETKSANSSPPKQYTETSVRPKSAPPRTHFDPKQIKPSLTETAQKQMNPIASTTNNTSKTDIVQESCIRESLVTAMLLRNSIPEPLRQLKPITNNTSTINQETLNNTTMASSSQEVIPYINKNTLGNEQQISKLIEHIISCTKNITFEALKNVPSIINDKLIEHPSYKKIKFKEAPWSSLISKEPNSINNIEDIKSLLCTNFTIETPLNPFYQNENNVPNLNAKLFTLAQIIFSCNIQPNNTLSENDLQKIFSYILYILYNDGKDASIIFTALQSFLAYPPLKKTTKLIPWPNLLDFSLLFNQIQYPIPTIPKAVQDILCLSIEKIQENHYSIMGIHESLLSLQNPVIKDTEDNIVAHVFLLNKKLHIDEIKNILANDTTRAVINVSKQRHPEKLFIGKDVYIISDIKTPMDLFSSECDYQYHFCGLPNIEKDELAEAIKRKIITINALNFPLDSKDEEQKTLLLNELNTFFAPKDTIKTLCEKYNSILFKFFPFITKNKIAWNFISTPFTLNSFDTKKLNLDLSQFNLTIITKIAQLPKMQNPTRGDMAKALILIKLANLCKIYNIDIDAFDNI